MLEQPAPAAAGRCRTDAAHARAGGSASRAAAGALRIGNAIGSALSRRLHGPAERRLMIPGGVALTAVAAVAFLWPRVARLAARRLLRFWLGLSLLVRAARQK